MAYLSLFNSEMYALVLLPLFIFVARVLDVSLGTIRVIFTRKGASKLVEVLKSEGYGVTSTDAEGIEGPVKIIYVIIDRHDLPNFIEIIKRYNPNAFYSVEDVRFVSRIFSHRRPWSERYYLNLLRSHRKGK